MNDSAAAEKLISNMARRIRLRRRDWRLTRTSMFSKFFVPRKLRTDAIGCKAPNSAIGTQHTQRHVMVKHRKFADDLFFESHSAGDANEIRLGKEAVVESHSAADA